MKEKKNFHCHQDKRLFVKFYTVPVSPKKFIKKKEQTYYLIDKYENKRDFISHWVKVKAHSFVFILDNILIN